MRDFFNFFERNKRGDLLVQQAEIDKASYAFVTRYIADGFRKVCDVDNLVSTSNNWSYKDIDASIMFMDHNSWVYFATKNLEIMKIGETEQPLGIETHEGSGVLVKTTESRLGRYRKHDKDHSGDDGVRQGLNEAIKNDDIISFWARPCQVINRTEKLGEADVIVPYTSHKFMERYYQNLYIEKVGRLPLLNKIKK